MMLNVQGRMAAGGRRCGGGAHHERVVALPARRIAEHADTAVGAQLGAAGPVLAQALDEVGGGEHGHRVAVVDQGGQLLAGQQARQRHHAGAGAHHAEHDLQDLDRIAHQHRHLAARADAAGVQRVGDAVDVGGEVAPGAAHVATDHGFLLRMGAGVDLEHIGDQHAGVVEGVHTGADVATQRRLAGAARHASRESLCPMHPGGVTCPIGNTGRPR
jgi:hypothetical protein